MVEVREIKKKAFNTMDLAAKEAMVKKLRKEHEKLVKGMFEFIDAQGGYLEFAYRYFPGEPLQVFKICHGEICELPLGLVKHLNNTYKKVRTLGDQQNIKLDSKVNYKNFGKISRVRFTTMDVM